MKNIIIFPERGPIPPCPSGYERTGSPYVFKLSFIHCRLRIKKTSKCEFKKNIEIQHCSHFNKMVNPSDCHSCPLTLSERQGTKETKINEQFTIQITQVTKIKGTESD